jgi:hypothetical protein
MGFSNPVREGLATGAAASSGPVRVRSLGNIRKFVKFVRSAATALLAVLACAPMLATGRPKTPLRVLCIAAFEYLARLRGGSLKSGQRLAMACACDFGALRDGFYDHKRLDRREYRSLRDALRRSAPEAATTRYIKQLRQAERNRPIVKADASGVADAVAAYRTQVLELSLAWLKEISGLPVEQSKFHALLGLTCLLQIADDLLDWKDDQAVGNPSYVTAFLVDWPRRALAPRLRVEAGDFLKGAFAAAREDPDALPFAVAGALTWAFVIVLLRAGFAQ